MWGYTLYMLAVVYIVHGTQIPTADSNYDLFSGGFDVLSNFVILRGLEYGTISGSAQVSRLANGTTRMSVVMKFSAPAAGIESESFVATLHKSKCDSQGGLILFDPYICGYDAVTCADPGSGAPPVSATTVLTYAGDGVFVGDVLWPVHLPDDASSRIDLDTLSVVVTEDVSAFALRMACASVSSSREQNAIAVLDSSFWPSATDFPVMQTATVVRSELGQTEIAVGICNSPSSCDGGGASRYVGTLMSGGVCGSGLSALSGIDFTFSPFTSATPLQTIAGTPYFQDPLCTDSTCDRTVVEISASSGAARGTLAIPHLVRADGDTMLITECASTSQTLADCSALGTPVMCMGFQNSDVAIGSTVEPGTGGTGGTAAPGTTAAATTTEASTTDVSAASGDSGLGESGQADDVTPLPRDPGAYECPTVTVLTSGKKGKKGKKGSQVLLEGDGGTCCLPRDPSSIFAQGVPHSNRMHLIGVVGVAMGTVFAALGAVLLIRNRASANADKSEFEYAALEANPAGDEKHAYGTH
eukprot:m.133814 g.133814  ORF g.133814 m.133814 type:complete len:529 (-) comp17548_c0_seq2:226-1812(-)